MPIFNNEFTFIHIPKCGGTTIEKFMVNNGCKMSMLAFLNGTKINNHSPQHCTYRELEELNLLTDKIFTIVRSEIDRVVSEYFYILQHRKDLNNLFEGFDEFLELFLDKKNYSLFDYHNLSNNEFLINNNGVIDSKIKIFNFFEIEKIENYLGLNGLKNYHEYKTQKYDILEQRHVNKIKNFFQ